ncbi:hypothetical protein [Rugamonas sp. DEMB1]|uniref:hypothetical protein n=1 Tax=Rugamonas sp. DEMB1 TaxID=3039386 RepID=UPI002446BA4A|nr:hypothetical protein [Rugamonas sp. DEMB1]WGG53651.1 hypothetical protein QC826_05845 [Rugamonas sp. DEMB1]
MADRHARHLGQARAARRLAAGRAAGRRLRLVGALLGGLGHGRVGVQLGGRRAALA